MNQKDNPALIYYYIIEEEQKIKKQIEELNKSLGNLSRLRANVKGGSVDASKIIGQIRTQSELDEIYNKITRDNFEECRE